MLNDEKHELNGSNSIAGKSRRNSNSDDRKKRFKKELLEVFQKNGYLIEGKDYEIKIRTTSGNIAWININCIETIK